MSEGAAKKEERRKFQAIKGTRDLLPPETALWNRVEQTAHEVFATFGFGEIRLPIFEGTELFARSIGAETDVVSKEMYTFQDRPAEMPTIEEVAADFAGYARKLVLFFKRAEIPQTSANRWAVGLLEKKLNEFDATGEQIRSKAKSGLAVDSEREKYKELFSELGSFTNSITLGDSISLRPEATASVCRAYIEHNMQQLPQPVKLYTIGPMFRRERPQKGRYRQFYQIDAEVLGGSDAPPIDAEVIEMVMTLFERLGLEGVQLHINSIGDRNCRPKYVELLRAELSKVKDKLGPDSQRRIETNPLRVLDSKVKEEQSIIESAA